jgi:hypothetical protein
MSKIKNPIRRKVSTILDVLIQQGKWAQYIDMLDSEGKFGRKQSMAILVALCQSVEDLEVLIEDLYFQLESKTKHGKTS